MPIQQLNLSKMTKKTVLLIAILLSLILTNSYAINATPEPKAENSS
ncbi:MAG: hypothetical protein J0I09_07050 [Sphingobacteriia bacterium]|nr:hypothetical protein [Sphingobacteriia bacterium]